MLSIRLQRVGRSKQAYFRLILQEKTANPKSKNLEILGSYDPRSKVYILKEDRIKYWLGQGAQATNTVYNMLIDKNILSGAKKKTASIVKPAVTETENTKSTQSTENTVLTETTPVVAEAAPAIVETTPTETAPVVEVAPVEAAPVAPEVMEEKPAEVVAEVPAETPAEVAPVTEATPVEETTPTETPAE